MSDIARLVEEVQRLRLDLADLGNRVLALENQQQSPAAPGAPVTVNYSFPVSASPYPEPSSPPHALAADSSAGAFSLPSSPGVVRTLPAQYSDEERRIAAISVGKFFARCLSGQHRGSSEKVNLPSRVYVLCRDIGGQTYNPIKLFHNFSSLKPFVGFCGDSVFAGFASLWEAKLAVSSAGLEWPEEPALPRHGGSA